MPDFPFHRYATLSLLPTHRGRGSLAPVAVVLMLLLGAGRAALAAPQEAPPPPEQVAADTTERPLEAEAPEVFIEAVSPDEEAEGPGGLAGGWQPFLFVLLAILFVVLSRVRPPAERMGWLAAAGVFLLLALLYGGVLLAGDDEEVGSTRTRSQNGQCRLEAEFGLRVMPPRPGGDERDILFRRLDHGLRRMDSNGHLLLKVKDARIDPEEGRVTFRYRRGPAAGRETVIFSEAVDSQAALSQLIEDTPPPRLDAPPGMGPQNDRVTERIQVEVDFDPAGVDDDCTPIREELTVTWHFNAAPIHFEWAPAARVPPRIRVPKHKSRVTVGPDIIDETTGIPGQVNKATRTRVSFHLEEPFRCCGERDRHHTIIQFVRHHWRLGSGRERRDAWNLDGPESQSERHGQGQDYDPTFTTDPAHGASTADEDNELVHVGPWDASGGSSVIVDDFPGLLAPDHARFLRQGGFFAWEFVTLLVCKEDSGSAQHYLDQGRVRARTRFQVRRDYDGGGSAPTLSATLLKGDPEGAPEVFEPCEDLGALLREMDLVDTFNKPRSHRLRLQ